MAHYAYLDENNIVTMTFAGVDETELIDGILPEQWYEQFDGRKCRRYSLNTRAGIHTNGKMPFRKNPGGIGWVYNDELDAFHEQQPFPSWALNPDTCLWEAPQPTPDGMGYWTWNETDQAWEQTPTTQDLTN